MTKRIGPYLVLRAGEGADTMTWPDPRDPSESAHALRYGEPTREQRLAAASVLEAYAHLIAELPQRARNERVTELREAMKAHPLEDTQ